MKILINSINYAPELIGIGKYTAEMAEWLARAGHDVRVVTAPPYYPQWKTANGYSAYKYNLSLINNVRVIRCPLWVPVRPSGIKRILHLASFAISALPVVLWLSVFWRPKVIFVVEPPLFCAPGVLVGGLLAGSKTWLHVQDFEVDAAFGLGLLESPMLRSLIHRIESWLMRRFNRVSTISIRMKEKLSIKGILPEKQMLFQNWVELENIFPMINKPALKTELGLSGDVLIVLYSGNMGKKQGLELVINAARGLENNNILFVLAGDGSAKERLKNSAKHLSNVTFIPLQPQARLNELLNLADIHILPQREGVEDLVMPSKLTNMLSSGRPVVATAEVGTQIEDIVKNCGIVVKPGDIVGVQNAIIELINNPSKREQLGKAGRVYAEKNWHKDDLLAAVFNDFI